MEYQYHFIHGTREQLLSDLATQMSDKRLQHILRVESTALDLAKHYGLDDQTTEAISVASLMHDYAKELPYAQVQKWAIAYWHYPTLEYQPNEILHGMAAAYICRTQYGCQDERILNAIAGHTIGWYEMDCVSQVVYLADYIEPQRTFDGVDKARELAYTNLTEAMWFKMIHTLRHLIAQKRPLFAGVVDIYNTWITRQEDL